MVGHCFRSQNSTRQTSLASSNDEKWFDADEGLMTKVQAPGP